MTKAKKQAEEAVGTRQILVNEADFIRTRDALITSWTRLDGAIRDAVHSYIDHSNAVLGGKDAIDHNSLNVMAWNGAAAAGTLSAPADDDAAPEKKKRKLRAYKPKDPNAPKRPLTAYLLYLDDMRPQIQAELGGGQKRGDISSEGTRRWNKLPESEQQKFKDRYKQSYELYKQEKAKYEAEVGVLPDEAAAAAVTPEDEVDDGEDELPVAAGATVDSDAETSSDDSDDDTSESEDEITKAPTPAPREPTPPAPVKTPKATKGARKTKKAADESDTPAPASSSPVKAKTFNSINGAKETSPAMKRKAPTAAAAKADGADEPAKKKTKKQLAAEAAAASSAPAPEAVTSASAAKDKKKGARKSVGA